MSDNAGDNKAVAVDRGVETPVDVKPVPWYEIVGVRTIRSYAQTLLGLSAIFMIIPTELPAPIQPSFVLGPIVARLIVALQWALVPAFIALLQNIVELLTKLDESFPRLRA